GELRKFAAAAAWSATASITGTRAGPGAGSTPRAGSWLPTRSVESSGGKLRQLEKLLHFERLGARLRINACGGAQRLAAQDIQTRSQHLAPLAEGGGGDAFEGDEEVPRWLVCTRREAHHRARHLGRRREGASWQVHDDARLADRLGDDREAAVG